MKIKSMFAAILSTALSASFIFSGCSQPAEDTSSKASESSVIAESSAASKDESSENDNTDQSSDNGSTVEEQTTQNVLNLNVGETYDLNIDLDKRNIDSKGLTFLSSNESIASVSEDGTISANKVGVIEINLKNEKGESIIEYVVNVSEAPLRQENTITPTVWEVTDKNGKIIYMMGSIHAADSAVLNMPDYFETAYEKCDSLAVECDISEVSSDTNFLFDYIKLYMYTDNTTIKDHVSEEAYNNAVEILKSEGLYSSMYDLYKPIMWTSFIETAALKESGLSSNYGVDSMLIDRAKTDKKTILELESVEFQMEMLAQIPDNIQTAIFDSYADENAFNDMQDDLKELYEHWKEGTVTAEEAIGDTEGMTQEEIQLMNEYNKIMLYDRNIGMAEKAHEYLDSGKTVMFVAGAAHFQGDKGIIKLMENDGCTVRELTTEDAEEKVREISVITQTIDEVSKEETDPGVPKAA
ncbi:MAG: TraB/GumN family protein [Clostridia bacterium]|nr:TraB/GumN family protein [Clostridia bacterium]